MNTGMMGKELQTPCGFIACKYTAQRADRQLAGTREMMCKSY